MLNIRSNSIKLGESVDEPLYLKRESSTPAEMVTCAKGTVSSLMHSWINPETVSHEYWSPSSPYSDYSRPQNQAGFPLEINVEKSLWDSFHGMPLIMSVGASSQLYGLKTSGTFSRPIKSEETEDIIIVPIREIPHEYAKIEISKYIQQAGGRKVYISELAEKLRLDIEQIMEIMEELETESRD